VGGLFSTEGNLVDTKVSIAFCDYWGGEGLFNNHNDDDDDKLE